MPLPEKPSSSEKFADLGQPRRVWAVAAIHAEHARLVSLHHALAQRFRTGDRIVYLGNMIGRGHAVVETIDALLDFRRAVLGVRGVVAGDVVFLRGAQEEMWQKLLQLQFAPNPREVLDWMMRQGVDATLAAYGGTTEQGFAAARGGAVALGRWTQALREAMQAHPGHANLFSALRRAAHTGRPAEGGRDGEAEAAAAGVLLVSAGLDPSRPLGHQGDSFWWGFTGFARLDRPFGGFARVVRGYDPAGQGVRLGEIAISLDQGCGSGGPLVAAGILPSGEVFELLEA